MYRMGNWLRDTWDTLRWTARDLRRALYGLSSTALYDLHQLERRLLERVFGPITAPPADDPLLTPNVDPNAPPTLVPPAPPAHPSRLQQAEHALHLHTPRPHVVRNANAVKAEQHAQAGFNQRLAVFLTAYVGTMQTAYGFSALAVVGLLGVLSILAPTVYTLVAWLSQTFIQLVLLPVIMVGQNVLNQHAELQADEQFKAVLNTEHEAEQTIAHLTAQDAELLKQTTELLKQTPVIEDSHAMLVEIVRRLEAAQGDDPPRERVAPDPASTTAPAPPRRKRPDASLPAAS